MRKTLVFALAPMALVFTTAVEAAVYADVDATGVVVNVVQWDGVAPYAVASGHALVPYASPAGIGSTWNGSVFSAPPASTSVIIDPPATQAYVTAKIADVVSVIPTVPTNAQIAALAPVQSVNTKTGATVVPTLCRQQSAALAIPTTNPGSVSWTFPNTNCAFAATPSCWSDITSGNPTAYAFDYPVNTARSTSTVTYSFTAHGSVLSISLGSLGLTAGPPASSTVVLTCTAAPA